MLQTCDCAPWPCSHLAQALWLSLQTQSLRKGAQEVDAALAFRCVHGQVEHSCIAAHLAVLFAALDAIGLPWT